MSDLLSLLFQAHFIKLSDITPSSSPEQFQTTCNRIITSLIYSYIKLKNYTFNNLDESGPTHLRTIPYLHMPQHNDDTISPIYFKHFYPQDTFIPLFEHFMFIFMLINTSQRSDTTATVSVVTCHQVTFFVTINAFYHLYHVCDQERK